MPPHTGKRLNFIVRTAHTCLLKYVQCAREIKVAFAFIFEAVVWQTCIQPYTLTQQHLLSEFSFERIVQLLHFARHPLCLLMFIRLTTIKPRNSFLSIFFIDLLIWNLSLCVATLKKERKTKGSCATLRLPKIKDHTFDVAWEKINFL